MCPWRRHQMETFSVLLTLCALNSPVSGEFPLKGPWRGALMFSLICAWTNGWVNNPDAGDLRRRRAQNDITVMNHCTGGCITHVTVLTYCTSPMHNRVHYVWYCDVQLNNAPLNDTLSDNDSEYHLYGSMRMTLSYRRLKIYLKVNKCMLVLQMHNHLRTYFSVKHIYQ